MNSVISKDILNQIVVRVQLAQQLSGKKLQSSSKYPYVQKNMCIDQNKVFLTYQTSLNNDSYIYKIQKLN